VLRLLDTQNCATYEHCTKFEKCICSHTIFDSVPEHHGDSIAFLHPLSLEPSSKGIALDIQILIGQCGVLMASYNSMTEAQLTSSNGRRKYTETHAGLSPCSLTTSLKYSGMVCVINGGWNINSQQVATVMIGCCSSERSIVFLIYRSHISIILTSLGPRSRDWVKSPRKRSGFEKATEVLEKRRVDVLAIATECRMDRKRCMSTSFPN
jgi:hypothetical protein